MTVFRPSSVAGPVDPETRNATNFREGEKGLICLLAPWGVTEERLRGIVAN